MSWTYYQKSGELLRDGIPFSTGYAGRYTGKNNPDMQGVRDTGPLPCGVYRIGDAYDHPTLGPITMNLTPDAANEMFGRGDFRIHGDSKKDPGLASHGCMVQPRAARLQIAQLVKSGERLLEVKREREAA
jgi:hypothetical protein